MKQGKHKLKQTTTDGKGFKRNNMKLTTNATEETERMRSVIQKGLCRYRRHETRVSSSTRGFKSIQSKHEHRNTRDDEESSESSDKGIFAEFSLHIQTCLGYASSLHSRTWKNSSASASHGIYTGRCAALLSWSIWLWCWWSLASVQMHSNAERERGKEEKKQLNVSRHRNFRSSHWSIVLAMMSRSRGHMYSIHNARWLFFLQPKIKCSSGFVTTLLVQV